MTDQAYKTTIAEAFNEEADQYMEQRYRDGQAGALRRHCFMRRQELVSEQVRWSGKRVLDLGSGPGVYFPSLVDSGCKVCHVDASWGMIQACARRVEKHGARRHALVVQADAEHLPFRSESFDGVICVGLAQYLRSDHLLLSEVRRVLRRGGEAIFSIPNKLSPLVWTYRLLVAPIRLIYRVTARAGLWAASARGRFVLRPTFVDRAIAPLAFVRHCRQVSLELRRTVFFCYSSPLTRDMAARAVIRWSDWCDKYLARTPMRYLARDCLITVTRRL